MPINSPRWLMPGLKKSSPPDPRHLWLWHHRERNETLYGCHAQGPVTGSLPGGWWLRTVNHSAQRRRTCFRIEKLKIWPIWPARIAVCRDKIWPNADLICKHEDFTEICWNSSPLLSSTGNPKVLSFGCDSSLWASFFFARNVHLLGISQPVGDYPQLGGWTWYQWTNGIGWFLSPAMGLKWWILFPNGHWNMGRMMFEIILCIYIYIYLGEHEHPAESYTSDIYIYILWSSPGRTRDSDRRIASPSVGFIMVLSAWEHRGLPLSSTAWWHLMTRLQRLSMVHDVHDFFLKLSCYLQ